MELGREPALALGAPLNQEDYAVVVYQGENTNSDGNIQDNSHDEDDEGTREVLRTNWYHLKSEEYLEANSIQCPNCLRRFSPDNLVNHERSCFRRQHLQAVGPDASDLTRNSPLIECFLCGKKFGTHSIGIHEPQCLKKWKLQHGDETPPENNRRAITVKSKDMPKFTRPRNAPTTTAGEDDAQEQDPAEQRERVRSAWADFFSKEDPKPSKEDVRSKPSKEDAHNKELQRAPSSVSPPLQSSNPRKPIMCQICGKAFAVPAFPAHQKLCLAMWRRSKNPKVVRQNSGKQDYVFKADGSLDCKATFDRIWENHLDSLVPCPTCGRKFFAERIEAHVSACKGYHH